MAENLKTDMFKFVSLRAPDTVTDFNIKHKYITDQKIIHVEGKSKLVPIDFSSNESKIGHLVYHAVFCKSEDNDKYTYADLFADILKETTPYYFQCGNTKHHLPNAQPLKLEALDKYPHIKRGNHYYLFPNKLETILSSEEFSIFSKVFIFLQQCISESGTIENLDKAVAKFFSKEKLTDVVFTKGQYSENYLNIKRKLFDALYLLYSIRRNVRASMEEIIQGLRVLHIMELTAIDSFVSALSDRQNRSQDDQALYTSIVLLFPEVEKASSGESLQNFPLIPNKEVLRQLLAADPIIHNIFTKLFYMNGPFNNIKPIGIGDLKVVKQWLVRYVKSEISDIHNIMSGEAKERLHSKLEKNEETTLSTQESNQEISSDTQTTDRFEVKKEVDSLLKNDWNIGGSIGFQYNQAPVVVNVNATAAYSSSSTESAKHAQELSREIVSRAVNNLQNRSYQQRSITKIFETKEDNKHSFTNQTDNHVSGIYRWLDKEYQAQLFNYGKRLMFEFVLPEPAALYVTSKLRGFESNTGIISKPVAPVLKTAQALNITPSQINAQKFYELQAIYDLKEFSYPKIEKTISATNIAAGSNKFTGSQGSAGVWHSDTFQCKFDNAIDYKIKKTYVSGSITFHDKTSGEDFALASVDPNEVNTLSIRVHGKEVYNEVNNDIIYWIKPNSTERAVSTSMPFNANETDISISFWDMKNYNINLYFTLQYSDEALLNWQTAVYNKILSIEEKRVQKINEELTYQYESSLAEYQRSLNEVKATALNEILKGKSEFYNREIINKEIKRQCISFLTKEFDSDQTDDGFGVIDCVGSYKTKYIMPEMHINTASSSSGAHDIYFKNSEFETTYPAPNLSKSKKKAQFIQFLEQAFEWQHISYVFYPYFWASPNKWIDLMNRLDSSDPQLTAFLQAGSAKVLIAVSPAYNQAVMHYLATQEPWDGGPSPVIGDSLYIPIHEETKAQQIDPATPEGEPWTFRVPTSLVYLEGSLDELPDLSAET